MDPTYWIEICPWLNCKNNTSADAMHNTASTQLDIATSQAATTAASIATTALIAVATAAAVAAATAAAAAATATTAVLLAAAIPAASTLCVVAEASAQCTMPTVRGLTPHLHSLADSIRDSIYRDGFAHITTAVLEHAGILTSEHAEALERAVLRLVSLGHSPSAVLAYDETWALAASLSPLLEEATGNVTQCDFFTFHVTAAAPGGFTGPHRDKPAAGNETFRADGAPMFTTVWVPLSAAPTDASCLVFLPAKRDAYYRVAGDNIAAAAPTPASWPDFEAQPATPGSCIAFSHRLLHWGSTSRAVAPRIALSFSFADPTFEEAFVPRASLPFPPLAARVALRAGQAIRYSSQSPLTKAQLALDSRTFHAGARWLADSYVDAVAGQAQGLKWKAQVTARRN